MSKSISALALAALVGLMCCVTVSAATLAVPQAHPRLWYSVQSGSPGFARLQRARLYLTQSPIEIPSGWSDGEKARQKALRSIVGGQSNPNNDVDCQQAVAWLKSFEFGVGSGVTASDPARWDGENAMLVYDWCHYAISPADRIVLLDRWNGYIQALNAKSWGGLTMAGNNYFWGYLRNSLLWGIASYHDNGAEQRQIAQAFINHALDTRYRDFANPEGGNRNVFRNWYEAFGVGGVSTEGLQYGPYMLDYPVIGFTTATDYGYDAWGAVPFWRDAVYYLQYAGLPMSTVARDNAAPHHAMFPFNDDQFFVNGRSGEDTGYASFLGAMMLRYPSKGLARHAKNWIDNRNAAPAWWVQAELATASVTPDAGSLPLDYYADGSQFFYGRSGLPTGSTAFMLQLGGADAFGDAAELAPQGGIGHSHLDLGNFQLWRKGRWITRETTGYFINPDGVRDWNNGPPVDPNNAVAHNTVLFEGKGQIHPRFGWPKVRRVQSASGFAFAAVDMIDSYRAPANETWLAKEDWPFAEVAVREFVYLRELEALVIFDRVKSGDDSLDPIYDALYTGPQMAGTQVRKSFVLHATGTGASESGSPFTLGPAMATAVVGDQRMDLRTLLPANPTYRIIEEGGAVGQFRLEYDVSGTQMSYLLNVVSARDATDLPVNATLQDLGNVWQVTLSHPQKGTATLTFQKGETSSGGSVRIGQAAAIPLRDNRQGMLINDNGVEWEGLGCHIVNVGGRYPICLPNPSSAPIPRRPGFPLLIPADTPSTPIPRRPGLPILTPTQSPGASVAPSSTKTLNPEPGSSFVSGPASKRGSVRVPGSAPSSKLESRLSRTRAPN